MEKRNYYIYSCVYLTVFSFDQFLSFYKMSIEDEFQNEWIVASVTGGVQKYIMTLPANPQNYQMNEQIPTGINENYSSLDKIVHSKRRL